jgi:hypothetical protein
MGAQYTRRTNLDRLTVFHSYREDVEEVFEETKPMQLFRKKNCRVFRDLKLLRCLPDRRAEVSEVLLLGIGDVKDLPKSFGESNQFWR